ncbi:MAG: glycogen debranching protein, partial [Desulfobacterales bacterium]|nr:glycogen debranching protein [Desulfobacterales bacterium]
MKLSDRITLSPVPGSRLLMFRGDTVTFTLLLTENRKGAAYLRTNIGRADITRTEIIRSVRYNDPPLGSDWFDIPMVRIEPRLFRLVLPLCREGHFEAKGCFVSTDDREAYWPAGPNVTINVEPADTCCANIIYNVFVRQFGPNKAGGFFENIPPAWVDGLDRSGYTVIPPSGTFRDLITELDFIVYELGCRILQLLPV